MYFQFVRNCGRLILWRFLWNVVRLLILARQSNKKGTMENDFVFVHGLGDSPDVWMPLVDSLGNPNCLMVTLPGHGKPESFTDLASSLGNAAVQLRDANLDRPIFVGHSAGALFALSLSFQIEPAGLVLLDQGFRKDKSIDVNYWLAQLDHSPARMVVEEIRNHVGSDRVSNARLLGNGLEHLTDETLKMLWAQGADDPWPILQLMLSSVVCPLLCVYAEKPTQEYEDWLKASASACSHFEVAGFAVQPAHHWFFVDHPDELASWIVSFFKNANPDSK